MGFLTLLYYKAYKALKKRVRVCACLCADELKRCKLRKKQTLCRPNRAAFLPPQSPQWGDATSLTNPDHR